LSDVHAYLEKAVRSFDAAELLLANENADFAASRAYYGCFYVAEALLSDEGLSVSTHAGVIGEYGRLFARTGRLDRRFHRLLNRSFQARQSADYDMDFDLDDAEVREMIVEGEAFLGTAKDYLERKDKGDTARQE
jgi:uncharacterized protein (UPF0332 family)